MAYRASVEDDGTASEPGHAVIRVRGWDAGVEGVVYAIARRESPQHLGAEGWGPERAWLQADHVEARDAELRLHVGPAVVGRVEPETTVELQVDAAGCRGPVVTRLAWHDVTPPYAGQTLGGGRSIGGPVRPAEDSGPARARSIATGSGLAEEPPREPEEVSEETLPEAPPPQALPALRRAPAVVAAAALLLVGLAVWGAYRSLVSEEPSPAPAAEEEEAEPVVAEEPAPEPSAPAAVAAAPTPPPPAEPTPPAPKPRRRAPARPSVAWWREPALPYAQHLAEAARAERGGDEFRALYHYERALRQEPEASDPPRQIARLGGHTPAFGVPSLRASVEPLVFWAQDEGPRLPPARRRADSRFARAGLPTVRVEARLFLSGDAQPASRVEHGMVWRRPDSEVRVLPLGETDMEVRPDGWSCIGTLAPAPDEQWQRGTHQVDFYFNGRKVSSGFFDVR